MKKLGGFKRHFRFTGQKHICAATKKEAPRASNRKTRKPNQNTYETNMELQAMSAQIVLCCDGS